MALLQKGGKGVGRGQWDTLLAALRIGHKAENDTIESGGGILPAALLTAPDVPIQASGAPLKIQLSSFPI